MVSFLSYTSRFTGKTILSCFSLTETGVKSVLKYEISIKERLDPVFIQRLINGRPYFTPVSAEVTLSFEKLSSHPNLKEKL